MFSDDKFAQMDICFTIYNFVMWKHFVLNLVIDVEKITPF